MDKLIASRGARVAGLAGLFGLLAGGPAFAQEAPLANQIAAIITGVDTLWVLMAAFLVFLMQAGFGMLEAGLIRAKNTANILMKNLMDFCMASIGFFIFGYAIMFGSGNPLFGTSGWLLIGAESGADVPLFAFWLFQAVFVGAAATIVAGGMAERMKFPAYVIYSFLISAFVYPVVGHWVWGGGWLAGLGFTDFAGSTVVHAVGGWAAFIGTRTLGPRIGKFSPDGAALAFVEANLDGGLRYLPRVTAIATGAVSAAAGIPTEGQALGAAWPPDGGTPRFGHEPEAVPGGVRAQAAGGFDVPLGYSRDGGALAVRRWSGSSFAEPGDARLQIVAGGERRTLDGFSRFHGWTAR